MKTFERNVRKITGKRPKKLIGGSKTWKVFLTNSGNYMKIGLGSKPNRSSYKGIKFSKKVPIVIHMRKSFKKLFRN